jgi:uncharacterized RDD family membrane protein YckC
MVKSMQTGGVTARSMMGPLLLSIVGGSAVAGLAWVASDIAYLVVVFPLGVGMAGAVVIWWIINRRRVRNLMAAAILAVTLSATTYLMIQQVNYLVFTREAFDYVRYYQYGEAFEFTDIPRIEQKVQDILSETTGSVGLWGYLKLEAMTGPAIGHLFHPADMFFLDLGETINPVVVWAYKLLEIALIVGIALASAAIAASRPFCPECEEWLGDGTHICPMRARSLEEFIASAPVQEASQARLLDRLVAALIDGILLILGALLMGQLIWFVVWVGALFFGNEWDVSHDIASNLTLIAGIPLTWLYFALSEGSFRQATPGKVVLRLTVTNLCGDTISFWRATVRFWAKIGSAAMLGIGLIMAGFTPKR